MQSHPCNRGLGFRVGNGHFENGQIKRKETGNGLSAQIRSPVPALWIRKRHSKKRSNRHDPKRNTEMIRALELIHSSVPPPKMHEDGNALNDILNNCPHRFLFGTELLQKKALCFHSIVTFVTFCLVYFPLCLKTVLPLYKMCPLQQVSLALFVPEFGLEPSHLSSTGNLSSLKQSQFGNFHKEL